MYVPLSYVCVNTTLRCLWIHLEHELNGRKRLSMQATVMVPYLDAGKSEMSNVSVPFGSIWLHFYSWLYSVLNLGVP